MRKRYIVASIGLILLGLGSSACSNSTAKKDKVTSHQTSKKSSNVNKFKGNSYKTKDGIFTLKKISNVKVNDPNESGADANYNIVVIVASFKNTSKKSISPSDFFDDNLKLEQKLDNRTHELDTSAGSDNEDSLEPYIKLIKANSDKVDPGKTIQFALDFDISDQNGDKLTNAYLLQPISPSSDDDIGKAAKFPAKTENLSLKVDDDSDDTDNSDSEDDSDTEEETTWEETYEETWEEDEE